MQLNTQTGWIDGARQVSSPNCDQRPEGAVISLLVIHAITMPPGKFGGHGVEALFTNALNPKEFPSCYADHHHFRVSAHLLIDRQGEIKQFVSLHDRAWHAGPSSFKGREACNDYSIGIELEGTDDLPFEPSQYQALRTLVNILQLAYPEITQDRIVGHCDIAPGRKTDPGPCFDWGQL